MTIPLGLRFEILGRDNFTCRYCGKHAPETELEVDHVYPRARGGSDQPSNLVATCRDCNRGKGDRVIEPPGQWESLVGKFFHTFCSGHRIESQGRIITSPAAGYFVVQLFEWLTGGRSFTGTRLVTMEQMVRERWAFYADSQDMDESYKYSGQDHREGTDCECRRVRDKENGHIAIPTQGA